MIRSFAAIAVTGALATMVQAQPLPMAMPGKDAPLPAAKPQSLPTNPTVMMPGIAMADAACSSCSSGTCYTRPGLFQRISGLWSGQRFARYDPMKCCTNQCEGNWCPVYTTRQCANTRGGGCEKCRRDRNGLGFGFGRFFGRRCETMCETSSATTECGTAGPWLGQACGPREKRTTCQATPYHSPVRYYFTSDTEPECPNGLCADGECRVSGHVATGLIRGHVAYPAGCIGGVPVFGELGGGRGVGHGGLRGRGHVNHNEYAGAPYHKGPCKNREQCFGLTGSHFDGNIRFARDERPAAPPVNASKPNEFGTGAFTDTNPRR